MTYLFFDIECANSFGGIGKMCSFGYVLCQEADDGSGFTVLETDDILMNPQAPFDWYLFKPGSKCTLSYSREDYQRQPDFSRFYSRISALLSAPDRLVIGFGCKNDISTIVCDCIRHDLPLPAFSCYDVHPLLEQHYQTQGGLSAFVEKLGIDTGDMAFHDSRADAWFTMKVTEKLLADRKASGSGKPLEELLHGNAPRAPLTAEHALKDIQRRLFRKWREAEEKQKEADAARKGESYKQKRIPKKLRVPKDFDWEKEFRQQIEKYRRQR